MLCNACGNRTRFDVFETKKVRAYHHFTLGGDDAVEEEEVLEHTLEKVVCRWCSSSDVDHEGYARQQSGAGGG